MPGAFGIALGPDVTQLKNMTCPSSRNQDRNCLTALSDEISQDLNGLLYAEDTPELLERAKYNRWLNPTLVPTDPPQPVAGGREYGVDFSIWQGSISSVRTEFHFATEAECEQEESRIEDLLERKYGRCKNPRLAFRGHMASSIGQCDANGLLEREISVFCSSDRLLLWYTHLSDGDRTEVLDGWMEKGRPDADSL